jgi:hypothetical protein
MTSKKEEEERYFIPDRPADKEEGRKRLSVLRKMNEEEG